MPDLNASLAGVQAAIAALIVAAESTGAFWKIPRAPGKWSPSQVVEHVARIMEESANVAAGVPSRFPTIPFFLRPVARLFMFKRALKRNAFPDGLKASEPMKPAVGLVSPAEGRIRLEGVLARFDQACRARAASGQDVASTIFGAVSVADFARFQELHVRHHLLQVPGLPGME